MHSRECFGCCADACVGALILLPHLPQPCRWEEVHPCEGLPDHVLVQLTIHPSYVSSNQIPQYTNQ